MGDEKSLTNQPIMNTDKLSIIKKLDIELHSTDFIFIGESGDFVRFSDRQIMISADDNEVQEELKLGSIPIRCTDLSKEKQLELIESIRKFNK